MGEKRKIIILIKEKTMQLNQDSKQLHKARQPRALARIPQSIPPSLQCRPLLSTWTTLLKSELLQQCSLP